MKRSFWGRCALMLVIFLFSLTSYGALVANSSYEGVAYFTFAAPNKIVRYDMQQESFLPEIALTNVPTAAAVTDNKLIVAYHRSAYSIDLETLTSSFIANTAADIQEISVVNGYIYLSQAGRDISIYSLADNSLVDNHSLFYSRTSLIGAENLNALYYRTTGVSPSDIHKLSLNPDGTILSDRDSPYHGDFPSARRLYLYPDASRVIDNQGIVYFAGDLSYAGSVAGDFDDMTFWQEDLLLRRGAQLIHYNAQLLEQGILDLASEPVMLASSNSQVFAFTESASRITATQLDLSELEVSEPGAPVDPNGLAYRPDFIEYAESSEELIFVDREVLSVFTWSVSSQAYDLSLRLTDAPTWVTYSEAHDRLYLGYSSGKISYFDMSVESPVEQGFTNLPTAVLGLKAAGNYLFAADNSGAWNRHYSIDINGTLIDSDEWRNVSSEYLWNPQTERIYHFRNGTSPNDIEWAELLQENGNLGADGDSPYHSSSVARAPLRLDPAGQLILTGSGKLHDAVSLTELNYLSNNIEDAAWVGSALYTLRQESSDWYLQEWSENYELLDEFLLPSTSAYRIISSDLGLLVLSLAESGPKIVLAGPQHDTDDDGVIDLRDNCPAERNSLQEDNDSDGLGDACDADADNDRLPNSLETSIGLNPLNASDAEDDLDQDGYSNLFEYLHGSLLNDESSVPEFVNHLSDGFESGELASYWSNGVGSSSAWVISSSIRAQGAYSVRSGSINNSQESVLVLDALLKPGNLSFDYFVSAERCCDYLTIRVDDQSIAFRSYAVDEWQTGTIELPNGAEKIEFIYHKDGSVSDGSDAVWLDNINFEAFLDTDNDGVLDDDDNCPAIANSEQSNMDFDAHGDVCDDDQDGDRIPDQVENLYDALDPRDPSDANEDYDGDGVSNFEEVSGGYNPDTKTEFPLLEMMKYFPLGDITWNYSGVDGAYQVTSTPAERKGRFTIRVSDADAEYLYERRENGLFLLEEQYGSQRIVYSNGLLILSDTMRLGETYAADTTVSLYEANDLVRQLSITKELELFSKGTEIFDGKEVSVIAVGYTLHIRIEGQEYTDTGQDLFGENLGYFGSNGDSLQSVNIRQLDESIAENDGGGGSFSLAVMLLLMLLLVGQADIRRLQKS